MCDFVLFPIRVGQHAVHHQYNPPRLKEDSVVNVAGTKQPFAFTSATPSKENRRRKCHNGHWGTWGEFDRHPLY